MTRAAATLLVLALALAACSGPEPVSLRIGDHAFTVIIPEGWEHVDYGESHQLRRGFARISLEARPWSARNLEKAAERAMAEAREDERREVAARRELQVGGRDALAVDTWDRVSHQYRRSYVLVNDGGDLLVIRMMQGEYAEMVQTWDELLASVAFVDTAAGGDGGDVAQ